MTLGSWTLSHRGPSVGDPVPRTARVFWTALLLCLACPIQCGPAAAQTKPDWTQYNVPFPAPPADGVGAAASLADRANLSIKYLACALENSFLEKTLIGLGGSLNENDPKANYEHFYENGSPRSLGMSRADFAYVLLGAMLLVSGISGAKTADMAAVAPALFPDMKKRGIHEGELVSLLAASGAMAETIPPSIVLIIIGSVTGVSIAALFTGGILPGVVPALALAIIARRRMAEGANVDRGIATVREIGRTFVVALPALLLPVLIRVSVMYGVATATEVATIGIAYAILAGLVIYRSFDWKLVYPALVGTASLAGAILFIIGAATSMSWALTQSNFSTRARERLGACAGRGLRLSRGLHRPVHRSWQRPRRHSCDGAVRAVAVPSGEAARRARSSLCDGGDPGDGHRPVLSAVRPRVLRGLLDRPGRSQRGAETHLELYGGAGHRPRHRRLSPLDLHRVPSMTTSGGDRAYRCRSARPAYLPTRDVRGRVLQR